MHKGFIQNFQLAGSEGDDRLPYLNKRGVFHGRNLALLEKDEIGRWRPRPQRQLETILAAGYGFPVDLSRRMQSFETIAKALNDNVPSLAAIALVQAQFPPLPDPAAAERMAKADEISKAGTGYLTQPRVPAGSPGAGQWTGEAVEALSALAERGMPWLLRASARLAGPLAIATGILFPDNAHLESSGAVPGFPDLKYRFSESRLTLIRDDGQGRANLLFDGLPDKDGFYRGRNGVVVGRAVGNSFMIDNDGVASRISANAQSGNSTNVAPDSTDPYSVFIKPPSNAWDRNGPKAPGYPGGTGDYADPKGGPNWVPNPNGPGWGWESKDGKVWVPTGQGSDAHGGPHWDVQDPRTGGYDNVRPPKSSDDD